jgi:hypothetical protein
MMNAYLLFLGLSTDMVEFCKANNFKFSVVSSLILGDN